MQVGRIKARMHRVGCNRSSEWTRIYMCPRGRVLGDSQGQVLGRVLSRETWELTLGGSEIWPRRCWPEADRLPDSFSTKMGLFKMSREWQLGGCNHGEPCACPPISREGEPFYRGEKEAGRAGVNEESMAFHWPSPHQERSVFQLPVGLCYGHRAWELPLLVSQFYLTEISVY